MRKVALLFGALVGCCVSFAQFQFGSVTGLVKDPSQAPVPGALVEIRSQTSAAHPGDAERYAVSAT